MTRPAIPSLVALAVLATGCAPCGTYGEMQIVGADAEQSTIISDTLALFSSWSGRDSVCVTTVEVVSGLEESGGNQLGGFQSAKRLIQLDGSQEDLALTLVHELCHEVDWNDKLTKRNPELFPYDSNAFDYDLRDDASRSRESFALTCEHGPWVLAAAEAIARGCDQDFEADGIAFVQDNVYPARGVRELVDAELRVLQLNLGSGALVDGSCLQ